MIVYEHSATSALIWVCAGIATALAAYSYWRFVHRNFRMFAMAFTRTLFFCLLAWCLFMPGRKDILTEQQKPRFVILLDTSKSMRLTPSPDAPDRWSAAQSVLGMSWKHTVAAECDVDIYKFAEEVGSELSGDEVQALEPAGSVTLLRNALDRITERYSGLNIMGCLLLSDGLDTREGVDDWALERRPFPVYTVSLEPDAAWTVEADLRIDAVNTPRRVSVNWKTELEAIVSGQGTKGEPVSVQLYKDDELHNELTVVIPDAGGSRPVVFDLEHPETGVFTYRVEVPPLEMESRTNDNKYAVAVQVITSRNHLLYVEGTPRWESKYLGRVLRANQRVLPLIFLRGPKGRFMTIGRAGNMTPEMREDQLAFFKIVVIGNLTREELGDARAENLVNFVDAGGSLILLGGANAWGPNGFADSPLRKLLPASMGAAGAREGEYGVRLTDAGRAHPAFAGDTELWDIIPQIRSLFPCLELKAGASSLVEADTAAGPEPVIVSLRYGQGKVAAVFTDSLWKWQLSPDATLNQPYRRFWDQFIAWLTPEEEELDSSPIDIFIDREDLFLGDEVELTVRGRTVDTLNDTVPVSCAITGPDLRTIPFSMGISYVTTASGKSVPGRVLTFKAEQPGLHAAVASMESAGTVVQSDPVSFFVQPYTPESRPGPANTNVLQAIAMSSGGRYCRSAEELDSTLNELTFSAVEEETAHYTSLWQRWLILCCLVALLTVEWIVRKGSNMP